MELSSDGALSLDSGWWSLLDSGWWSLSANGEGNGPDSPTPDGTVLRNLLGDSGSGEDSGAESGEEAGTLGVESPRSTTLRAQFENLDVNTTGREEPSGEGLDTLGRVA